MKFTPIAVLSLVLVGCAAPPRLLINQDGRVTRCAAYGWGLAGSVTAQTANDQCVEDARAAGALPFSEAGGIGIVPSTDASSTKILKVSPGSPAERAGVRGGDFIVAVDGQAVSSNADARRLVFGRANTPVQITYRSNGVEKTVSLVRWSMSSATAK